MRVSIERTYRVTFVILALLQAASTLPAQEGGFRSRRMVTPPDELASLRGVIVETVAPETWADAGTGGKASIVAIDKWNLLVVSQSDRNHESIQDLLNTLSRAISVRNGDSDNSRVPVYLACDDAEKKGLEKIRTELSNETKIDFLDEPLSDAVNYLEQLHGIQIELDGRVLNEMHDRPIAKQLSGVTLRSALDLMLRDLELSYTLHDGVLLITTPNIIETLHTTKVYDLSKLVSN